MILPRDKPRPKCGDCLFYIGNWKIILADNSEMYRCAEDSQCNQYSGRRRNRMACCCDFFLPNSSEVQNAL